MKLFKPQETLGDLYLKQSSSCQEYSSVVDVLYFALFCFISHKISHHSHHKYEKILSSQNRGGFRVRPVSRATDVFFAKK